MRKTLLALVSAATLAACDGGRTASLCAGDDECLAGGYDASKADGAAKKVVAQMNDLTIVYPLPKSKSDLAAMLKASSSGEHGALLPRMLYSPRFPDPQGGGAIGSDAGMKYDDLRVVAVRFDPCFAAVGEIKHPEKCDNQVRLIFQDLSIASDGGSALDGAVHAFYRVTRPELVQAIRDVIALRRNAGQTRSMGALQPHPLLVKQGLDGEFAQKLGALLLANAGEENLIRFTHLRSQNLQTSWFFSGFDVSGEDTKAMAIAGLAKNTTTVNFFAGFVAPMAGGFSTPTTTKDDLAVLVNIDSEKKASKAKLQAAFDASLRIQNPDFHSPNTIDCASCHVAESAQKLMGEDIARLSALDNQLAFAADPDFVSATSVRQTTSVRKQSGINVHMLSYKLDKLMIGARVVNETASVLAYVNGELLK